MDGPNKKQGANGIADMVAEAEEQKITISEWILQGQIRELTLSREILMEKMRQRLQVMREGIETGLDPALRSVSGMSGGNAWRLKQAHLEGKLAADPLSAGLMIRAMAMSETNAAMGRIVACPTAGSCGIVPSVLLSLMEERNIPEERVVMALFHVAGVGMVIADQASVSGARGGCQAECGSACAMAASAAVELMGGTPRMSAHACAIALKTLLGLVCDPVAGLVEVPCAKRNVSGAVNAMAAANMALAGIESAIPADEVIWAMKQIGDSMSGTLKETAQGGLAVTPTGLRIAAELRRIEGVT